MIQFLRVGILLLRTNYILPIQSINESFFNPRASVEEPTAVTVSPFAVSRNHGNTPIATERSKNGNFANCGFKD